MFAPPPAQHFTTIDARSRVEQSLHQRQQAKSTSSGDAEPHTLSSIRLSISKDKKPKSRTRRVFEAKARKNKIRSIQNSHAADTLRYSHQGTDASSSYVIFQQQQSIEASPGQRGITVSPFEEAEQRRKIRGPPIKASWLRIPTDRTEDLSKLLPALEFEPFTPESTDRTLVDMSAVSTLAIEHYQSKPLPPLDPRTATLCNVEKKRGSATIRNSSHTGSTGPKNIVNSPIVHPGDAWHSPTHSARFIDRMKVRIALSAAQLDPNDRGDQLHRDSPSSDNATNGNVRAESVRSDTSLDVQSELSCDSGVVIKEQTDGKMSLQSKVRRTKSRSTTAPAHARNSDPPNTPTSILRTPIEMYQAHLHTTESDISTSRADFEENLSIESTAVSPEARSSPAGFSDRSRASTRVEAVAKNDEASTQSGVATPRAISIRLRCGSTLTIEPPEATAWKRSIYTHGPIRLLKPIGKPRYSSVASLEQFQDALESIPPERLRRRSDDAVFDDVCEWYTQYGFDDVSFDGDLLAGEVQGETDSLAADNDDPARYTLPGEVSDAKVLERSAVTKSTIRPRRFKQSQMPPMPIMPPIETEESLRARGIARLKSCKVKRERSQ